MSTFYVCTLIYFFSVLKFFLGVDYTFYIYAYIIYVCLHYIYMFAVLYRYIGIGVHRR